MSPRPRGSGPRRPPKPQPNPWLVGLALALVLTTAGVVAFGLMHGGGGSVTAGSTTSTSLADGATTTSLPGGETTTSSGGGDGTTITLPEGGTDGGEIAAVGDPIPISDLKLSSNDIGPLDFGADGDEVLGRLVATFGPPTDDTGFRVGDGTFGECPGWSIRVVRWGPLNIVVRGEPGDNAFVSYRLDLRYGGVSSPTTDIATLSGLRVMDTVAELEATYANYYVGFVVDEDVGLVFELKLTANDPVLLWGPVDSQADDAEVTGIYSPDACDQTAASPTTTTTAGA
jgi:hypothetical protein